MTETIQGIDSNDNTFTKADLILIIISCSIIGIVLIITFYQICKDGPIFHECYNRFCIKKKENELELRNVV